jgi:hypothetical protein
MSDHSSIERPRVHKFDNTDHRSSLRDRDNLGSVLQWQGLEDTSQSRKLRSSRDTASSVRISFRVDRPLVNCGFRIRTQPDIACL